MNNSYSDNNDKARCSVIGCNYFTHGPRFSKCSTHLGRSDENNQRLKDYLINAGVTKNRDETNQDYQLRCKNMTLSRQKLINNMNI